MKAPIMNTSAAVPGSWFIIVPRTLNVRASSFPRLSKASKNLRAKMKMVTELTQGDTQRTPGNVHFKTSERKGRDFAFGARGNELYSP